MTVSEGPGGHYRLSITEDKMLAVLEANAPAQFKQESLVEYLRDEVGLASVDRIAVQDFIRRCADSDGLISTAVSNGLPPTDGQDGRLAWAEGLDDPEPVDEAQRINWYERNGLKTVEKGQTFARLVPPTPPKDGVDVFGGAVPAQEGKPLKIIAGTNVRISQDGLRFVAETEGLVRERGNTLSVEPIYKVKGNVDFEVGNIDFSGFVIIAGNVLDLFEVKATRGMLIKGLVEGARVESSDDVTIKGGVAGKHTCHLVVGGDLRANYLDRANVQCGGSVEVNMEVINSRVEAQGSVRVKQAGIIGGRVVAGVSIETRKLGSEGGTRTEVFVGQDPLKAARLGELFKQGRQLFDAKRKRDREIEVLDRLQNRLPAGKKTLLEDLLHEQAEREKELQEVWREYNALKSYLKQLASDAVLMVKDVIYPGAVIEMCGVRREITERIEGPLQAKFDPRKRIVLISSVSPEK